MIGREDEVRGHREKARSAQYVVLAAFLIIVSRLVYLQILKGDEFRKFSENNRLKKERLYASRGLIFDRNGKIIVENRAAFDVVLLSQYYHFSNDVNNQLAEVLGLESEELEKRLHRIRRTPSFYPVLLRSDVSKDVIAGVEMAIVGNTFGFKGIDIEATVQRRYPYGEMGAQVLGYVGEVDPKDIQRSKDVLQPGDFIGKQGIERQYDKELRGSNGTGYVEVDAMGRRRKNEASERVLGFVAQKEPVPGKDLHLTIDIDLQVAAAKALEMRGYTGSVVALDPRSGEVLAMVSSPSYHPERISGREVNAKFWRQLSTSPDRPLKNRAINDHYYPGSTFKLFVAIAAAAEGIANSKTTFTCNGHIQFGKRRFHCWKRHGQTDFTRAIKESCDVFFYNLGLQLGIDKIAKYARLFGLGKLTEIRLPGEQAGLIPDTAWKFKTYNEPWHPGETLSVSIGQGAVDVTPLQLVTAYAAIGNGGFVYRPYVVRRIESQTGEVLQDFQPQLSSRADVPEEVLKLVKGGLEKVVNEPGGTAFLSKSKKTVISGKTGTVQLRTFTDIMKRKCEEMPRKERHHGWFVGFAPKDNPQIAVVTIAEHACHGSAAAPVVRDVIDAYMDKVNPQGSVEHPKKTVPVDPIPTGDMDE